MSALSVLLYVALIVYVLGRKVQGQTVTETRKLFVLPVIVTVIGYGDLTHAGLGGADVAVTVIGSVVALALGVQRGRVDKVSTREGAPFVQWGVASLVLFGVNILAKVVIDRRHRRPASQPCRRSDLARTSGGIPSPRGA